MRLRAIPCILMIALCSLLAAVCAIAQPQYTVTDLGEFLPTDVNEHGQVIGRVGGRPGKYKDGAVILMQDLGHGGRPYRWSDATPGVSVGAVTIPTNGIQAAAQWDASGALTLLYTRDQLHGSIANGQNVQGVTSGFGGCMDAIYGGPVSSAFRWDIPESLTILDTQDGQWSESSGIDGQGNVWGTDGTNPVVWDVQGVKSIVPGSPGRWTDVLAVSSPGVGVGIATTQRSGGNFESVPLRATIAQGFSVLAVLSGGAQCQPSDVNNASTIVGNCWMADGSIVPVLWGGGTIRRISIELPEGYRNLTMTGLNDQGMLTGTVLVPDNEPEPAPPFRPKGLLFTPISPREPPFLALYLNQSTFTTRQTLRMDLELHNPGPALTTDVYVGVILPDSETVIWFTNLSPLDGVSMPMSSNPSSYQPFLRHVTWPADLHALQTDYLTYIFTGLETPGTYHLLVGWTKPGSLQDGSIDDGDVMALVWTPVHFSRGATSDLYATMRAIQARHAQR